MTALRACSLQQRFAVSDWAAAAPTMEAIVEAAKPGGSTARLKSVIWVSRAAFYFDDRDGRRLSLMQK